jgi:hypothetical protein
MRNLLYMVNAKWYDSSNGTYTPIAGSPFSNSGSRKFLHQEATLMVKRIGC